MRSRAVRGAGLAAFVFLLIQLGALALVPTFTAAGYRTVEDPSDPTISLVYVGAILVATVGMLAAFRFDHQWVVRGVILAAGAMLAWYVFSVLLPPLWALLPAAAVAVALYVHPEWYVVDAAGVVMGAGAAGLFGISVGLLPALVLLVVLAVYDAISVYGTGHMIDLAEGVMDLRIPVVLVIPLTLSYSLLADDFSASVRPDAESETDAESDADNESADEGENAGVAEDVEPAAESEGAELAEGSEPAEGAGPAEDAEGDPDPIAEREVFFVGLGDAVIPTILVASAASFSPAAPLGVGGLPALNLPALLAMGGTFLGLFVLLRAVFRGRPHAGLPLLNGGAVGGYLLGSFLAGVPLAEALGIAAYL